MEITIDTRNKMIAIALFLHWRLGYEVDIKPPVTTRNIINMNKMSSFAKEWLKQNTNAYDGEAVFV